MNKRTVRISYKVKAALDPELHVRSCFAGFRPPAQRYPTKAKQIPNLRCLEGLATLEMLEQVQLELRVSLGSTWNTTPEFRKMALFNYCFKCQTAGEANACV